MGALRVAGVIVVLCLAIPSVRAAEPGYRGRVVYASDGSIFVSSADDRARWRLTNSHSDFSPEWSPDGRNVAFLRSEDDGVDLYVVPTTGGSATRLAENVDLTFDWSPDGTRIAFSSSGTDLLPGTPHIFVVGVSSGVSEQVTDAERSDVSPQWSPDGRSLAFVGSPPRGLAAPDAPDSDVYRLDLADGNVSLLTKHPDPDYGPVWSPDGKQIAFLSARDSAEDSGELAPELYVMRASGENERRLTFRPGAHDTAPQWSPDGGLIAFVEFEGSAEEAEGRLRVMRPDGSRERVVTDSDRMMAWDPSWSPSGRQLVFVASRVGTDRRNRDTEVAFAHLSNERVTTLTDNARFEWGPDWR